MGDLSLFWAEEQRTLALEKAGKAGLNTDEPYLCLAPGAAHYTKRWPAGYFLQLSKMLVQKYQIKIAILGGSEDREIGTSLAQPGQIFDLTAKLSLLESAVILSKSLAVVTNDSGLMHMATAVKIPVLAIFGSTVREFGFFPYRGQSIVLENKRLSCRPCTHIGRERCPKKHFDCMLKIDHVQAFDKLSTLDHKKTKSINR